MSKYLVIFLVISILVILAWFGYKNWDKITKLKNLFNWECVDISKIENDNSKLKKDIELIDIERKSLQPQISKYEKMTDSLCKIDAVYKLEILKLKEQTKVLERRLKSSKDSVKKYKLVWDENQKKYNKFKESQKKPSNSQTLLFFKNY